eukprot:1183761-Rhodomonas_salina.3
MSYSFVRNFAEGVCAIYLPSSRHARVGYLCTGILYVNILKSLRFYCQCRCPVPIYTYRLPPYEPISHIRYLCLYLAYLPTSLLCNCCAGPVPRQRGFGTRRDVGTRLRECEDEIEVLRRRLEGREKEKEASAGAVSALQVMP